MSSFIFAIPSNGDHTLILDTRASYIQQFVAVNWTDLRLSLMLSLTKQSDPNDASGLFESFGAGEDNNQVYIGFKSSDGLLPSQTNFFGVSTRLVPDAVARFCGCVGVANESPARQHSA